MSDAEKINIRCQFFCPTMRYVNSKTPWRSLNHIPHIIECPNLCRTIFHFWVFNSIHHAVKCTPIKIDNRIALFHTCTCLVEAIQIADKIIIFTFIRIPLNFGQSSSTSGIDNQRRRTPQLLCCGIHFLCQLSKDSFMTCFGTVVVIIIASNKTYCQKAKQ